MWCRGRGKLCGSLLHKCCNSRGWWHRCSVVRVHRLSWWVLHGHVRGSCWVIGGLVCWCCAGCRLHPACSFSATIGGVRLGVGLQGKGWGRQVQRPRLVAVHGCCKRRRLIEGGLQV